MRVLGVLFGNDARILHDRNLRIILLAALLGPLGVGIVSPALDSLTDPYGVTPANIGLMMSFFTAPAIVMIPVAGMLADRYGRKYVLISALVISGMAGTAMAFTTDYSVVLGLRLVQGIGFAGLTPILVTSIGDSYVGSEEATGQGLRFTVAGVGATVFPLLAGVLVIIAWWYPFLLYALAIPIAVAVYLWFDEPAPSLSPPANQTGGSEYRRELVLLAKHPRVAAVLIARALPLVIWIGFLTYNSIIVVRFLGGSAPQAGLLTATGFFTSALAGSQAGRVTDWFDSRIAPLIGAHVFLAVGFGSILFAPGISTAMVGVAVAGFGLGVVASLYRSVITGMAPEHLRAGLVSLSEAGGRVAVTVTPILMGGMIAGLSPTIGFKTAVHFAGVCAIVVGGGGGMLCLLAARAAPPLPDDFPTVFGG